MIGNLGKELHILIAICVFGGTSYTQVSTWKGLVTQRNPHPGKKPGINKWLVSFRKFLEGFRICAGCGGDPAWPHPFGPSSHPLPFYFSAIDESPLHHVGTLYPH